MSIPRTVLYVAAALTVVAASVHAWAAPEHFEEWWGYGFFFLLVAAAQGVYGPALLGWPRRPVFLAGVVGNLAVIVLYLVTRTVGVPIFGPHAGEVEEVGVVDLVATLAEMGLVVALVALLWSVRRSGSRSLGRERAGVPVAVEMGSGLSRRDFLRAAGVVGAVGVSGGALGAHAARSCRARGAPRRGGSYTWRPRR